MGSLRGEMANMPSCNMVVSEFELQLCFYIYFRTNNRKESYEPRLTS